MFASRRRSSALPDGSGGRASGRPRLPRRDAIRGPPIGPRVVVVGTGRSGTHSLTELFQAAGLQAEHEPNQFTTVQMAWQYVHRYNPDEMIAEILQRVDWPEVVVDYKMLELIPIVDELWSPRWVFVTRNARDTVASMVHKDWYHPSDDTQPHTYLWWFNKEGKMWQDTNYPGHRTRPDLLGLLPEDEWKAMPQPERCCWWWQHAIHVAATHLIDRSFWGGHLERLDTASLGKWLGLSLGELPHMDITGSAWNPDWDGFYDQWCRDVDDRLGYRITGV